MNMHAQQQYGSTRDVEGAVCVLDERGEVRCDFAPPKRSRVVHAPANGKPQGLPPGCVVDLSTGLWACPGSPADGSDAKVQRVFTDDAGHMWAVAGSDQVVVPATRSIAVGARSNGGREIPAGQFFTPPTQQNRSTTMSPEQQQMMALAQYQQNQQRGVDVGACGVPMQGYARNPGLPAPPYGPEVATALGCAPFGPVGPLAQNCSVFNQCLLPFGIRFGIDAAGNFYAPSQIGLFTAGLTSAGPFAQFFPTSGTYTIQGVTTFINPGVVEIISVITGDLQVPLNPGPFDLATYNTTDCFCPVDWGCISVTSPLRIAARALPDPATGLPPTTVIGVELVLFGLKQSAINACGPINNCGPLGPWGMVPGAAPVGLV